VDPRRRDVLVTGASYGLGAAVASAARAAGDRVFSMSRTAPASGVDGWVKADLGDLDDIGRAVSTLRAEVNGAFGGVVLNAALADKSSSQWTVEQVERHLRINAIGPFALWDGLEKAGLVGHPCNVVLMGSFLQNGNTRQPAYAMSKAALWSWMRSYTMSQTVDGPVSMNMVWPGRVLTPANPDRPLPEGDPNLFYSAERVAEVVMYLLNQPPFGPRGTVIDLGRS
jgi:NAD(P)-dependent dehydrogenase (short-subunit alcohol dehydrogenase family)